MRIAGGILGGILVALVIRDAFATIVMARRGEATPRLTYLLYKATWPGYAAIAKRIRSGSAREQYLSVYGPSSLLVLVALYAAGMILGFGLLHWAVGMQPIGMSGNLFNDVYFSATTMFAVSTGNPANPISKLVVMLESGLGMMFLGLMVSYLPVLYQHFSRREVHVMLLDARSGSPPTASGLLDGVHLPASLTRQLAEWEQWAAELLQNQLSYPMLAYFRSQQTNQSWLAALIAIVDAAAIVTVCSDGDLNSQARLTFAVGRHALADLAKVFRGPVRTGWPDRLTSEAFASLRDELGKDTLAFDRHRLDQRELTKLLRMYEPYAYTLSEYFLVALPRWIPSRRTGENWSLSDADRQREIFAVSDPYKS